MAKDGTRRGGARIGAGRKKNALVDKINDDRLKDTYILPTPAGLEATDMPPINDYLKQEQKNGEKFYVEEIFKEMWNWLKIHECEALVNQQLIEQYAMTVSRWIQCMFAKKYLDDKGLDYEEIDVFQDEEAMIHIKSLGYQTMPVISINGEYHTGFRPDLLAKAGE